MSKKDAIEDVYPLTPLQEGLLFHSVYAPGGGQYHDQFSAVLRGPLRPEHLAEAWQAVVTATPILRTAFSWKAGGAPLQVVVRRAEAPLHTEDWRGLSPEAQAARRAEYMAEDVRRGFDLARPPLTRAALIRIGDDAWFFLWSRHHLLLDGWSVTLVLRAWLNAYGELCRGRTPSFPPPRPFREYVEWLKRQDEGRAQAFWRNELGDLEEPASLGLANSLPALRAEENLPRRSPVGGEDGLPAEESRHGEIDLLLGADESEALRQLARSARVTLAAVFQGAWALLLARLSGDRNVLFGLTVAGRPAALPGVEAMVGLFINTLPLRLPIRSDEPLGAWLRAGHERASAAREFEHTPLVKIQGWSGVARDRPLFESLLVVENYPADQALSGALESVRIEAARSHERTHYPVTLIAAPGDRIGLRLLHDRARLTDTQAARWIGGLRTLLGAMTRDASKVERIDPNALSDVASRTSASGSTRSTLDEPVGRLGILGPTEEARLLREWNATARARDGSATLPSLVAAQAARTPQAVAVLDGRERLTYAELRRRAGELAVRLRAAGAGPERCVGVCLERSAGLVVALLAVLESGAAYVPLDPVYPADRLEFMAGDAQLAVLLTQPGLEDRLPAHTVPTVYVAPGPAEGEDGPPSGTAGTTTGAGPALPANLAYLIYTSGSTGRPKATAIEHRQAAALVQWALTVFSPRELTGVLFSTSMCFDLSVFEVFVTLAAGGKVIVAENALVLPLHPARGEVTLLNTVPSAAAELARQEAIPPSVVTICLAGEPLSAALSDRLYSFPTVERVCDLYGPSEDTTYSTFAQRVRGGPATIGRVIDNSRLYLLDDDLQPAPLGAIGEIHLAGEGLARGYLGRPDLTAERFGPDPFAREPGGRLYRTGDLARFREDGQLEYLGRRDHQVKIRGFRIELGEIQARLEAHPELAEAAVLAREHPARGKYLAAFVASKPGAAPTVERLAAWIRETLPAYMMPSAWHFLPQLPRTPNGKLDRRALPADPIDSGAAAAEAAPRPGDPVGEIVAGIWAQVLGVGSVRSGDNFFELGGHSLLATQAVARVRTALQAEVPLRTLFEHPTLGAFAAAVRAQRNGADPAAEEAVPPRPAGSEPPLSFAQERMWTMARLAPDSPAYHVPAVLEATGELDVGALRRALAAVVARHEALRMSFPERDGRPSVAVAAESDAGLTVTDLREFPEPGRLAEARRIAVAESWAPFDLARGPLLRARLLWLEPRRYWLLLTVHHIAIDGWSEWILVRELQEQYAGREWGEPAPKPLGYGDYACWQRRRAQAGELGRQVQWWRDELAQIPLLELPLDGERPALLTNRGGLRRSAVGEGEAERLRAIARAEGATLFMVLLAAWEIWLWRDTGQLDFGVGVPVAGRTRRDLEGMIGLFVNTVVIRSDVAEEIDFPALVRRVRERTLQAYDRQEAPFEQVVEAVQPPRHVNRTPLFQVLFALPNTPRADLELGALKIAPVEIPTTGAKFELTLTAVENRDGTVALNLEFNRDLFGEETAARFLARYEEILRAVAAGTDASLRNLVDWPLVPRAAIDRRVPPAPATPAAAAAFAAPQGRIEALLAGLWSELLRAPRVGRLDNFFALGGDSILALQVSARAAAAGVRVPPQAVFVHQTLAELAAAAQEAPAAADDGWAPAGEEVPLTPIQAWFFEMNFAQPEHWNQSALFVTPPDFDAARFDAALRRAAGRHEALQLRFSRGAGEGTARRGAPEGSIAFAQAPWSERSLAVDGAQAGLDPARGPLLRAVFWAAPDRGEGRLLLVVHHLAIDIVSWQVLLEDLAAAYAAPERSFPPGPAWSRWARAVRAEVASAATLAELAWWRAVPAGPPLPRDRLAPGRGVVADAATVEGVLSAEETRVLLRETGEAHRAQINELLLTALAQALREWTGASAHTVALEGHGREAFPGSPAVERAVGWFTTLFPLRLDLSAAGPAAGSELKSVKEQWRAVPRRGFGYGLLRYAGPAGARAELGAQPWPEICFNYLGQLDAAAGVAGFRAAEESRGADQGAKNARPFLLEVNAAVRQGALRCVWSYSRAHHQAATVQRLADRFGAALRALMAPGDGRGAATPSDFSAPGLSQADLDKILARQIGR
jgi:amino acid adenylation domain-containing protein/non-ribosomal peptide synthase protein (TIGR01720 family)